MPKPNKPEANSNNDGENDTDLTEESEQEAKKVKEKKHDAGAADLEKVTDYAEETEISESDFIGVMRKYKSTDYFPMTDYRKCVLISLY